MQDDNFNIEPAIFSYQAVVAIFVKLLGKSEFSARLPSVISSILLIFITFLLCKKLYNGKTALFSSLLLGASIGFIFYATQALYVMFTSLMIYISLYLLISILINNRLRDYILYPFFLFLALTSHPLAYLIIPTSVVIIIYFGKLSLCKLNYRKIILSTFIFLILYGPFLFFFWRGLPFFHKLNSINFISASHTSPLFYPKIIMYELSSDLFEEQIIPDPYLNLFLPFKMIVFIIGLCFLLSKFVKGDRASILFSILLFLPLLFLSFFNLKSGRYLLLYLLPPISVSVALGINQILKFIGKFSKQVTALILILLIFFPSIWLHGKELVFKQIWIYKCLLSPPEDNFQEIKFQSDFLNKHAVEGDTIITTSDYLGLEYYTKKHVFGFLNVNSSNESFMQIVRNSPRTWIVDNLPVFDLCLDVDYNTKEYEAISAMEKYNDFIKYYRDKCRIITENNQLSWKGITTKIYLCGEGG